MSLSTYQAKSSAVPMRLLRTKLFVPRAHPDLVLRPRLLAALDRGCHRKLALISAPAGFGKSTMLSAWVAQQDGLGVGWVSLDARDNDPIQFWSYVLAALDGVWPGRWKTSEAMLRSPQAPPIEGVLTEVLNVLAACEGTAVLILDDYHEIVEPAIHEGVSFLLAHLPPHLCLILSGRADPPLPLAQLRARRELVEIRAPDLRFTRAESDDFLNRVMGLALRSDDVAALASLTEGWAAGLQLAALSIQEAEDVEGFIASFSGEHKYIFDYLAQEILSRQTPETRAFLLQTSVLDRMSGPLCDAVTGREDGQRTLEALERSNLFVIPLDQERHWYRYHHLFLDFLRSQLADEVGDRAEIATLHHRAAEWLADHDDIAEAIDHALAAEDYTWAKALIERTVPYMFLRGGLRLLLGWIERLPGALLRQDAQLSMAAAWAYLATGQQDAVEARLHDVEQLTLVGVDDAGEPDSLPVTVRGPLAEIACVRSTLSFNRGDLAGVQARSRQARDYLSDDVQVGAFNYRLSLLGILAFNQALAEEYSGRTSAALRTFEEAIDLLREDDNPHLLPMAISHYGQLQVLQGRLLDAASTYREALREAERYATPSPLSGLAHTALGSLLYQWDELDHAAEYLERGIELGRPWALWEILVGGYFGLARIDLAHGEAETAMQRLDALADYATVIKMSWALAPLESYRALLALRTGDVDAAVAWARGIDLPSEGMISFMLQPYALILARIRLAEGRFAEGLDLLARLIAGAEPAGCMDRVLEALVVRALILDAQGDRDAALAVLGSAVEIAAPQRYVRLFVDEGAPMHALLAALPGHGDDVARLLDAFEDLPPVAIPAPPADLTSPPVRSAAVELSEPLTERELDILTLMAEGLTNQEIADRLFVSINTVKTHVKNIYSKLDVHNRAQAILRAADAGLL